MIINAMRENAMLCLDPWCSVVGKEEKKRAQLAALGIDYEFPGYKAVIGDGAKKSPKQSPKRKRAAEAPAKVEKKKSKKKA